MKPPVTDLTHEPKLHILKAQEQTDLFIGFINDYFCHQKPL